MLEIPSRAGFSALTEATARIVQPVLIGFARVTDGGRISILYANPHGMGEFVLPASEVPTVMIPDGAGVREASAAGLNDKPQGAIEWTLLVAGTRRVVSIDMADAGAPMAFWAGLSGAEPLTAAQIEKLSGLAKSSLPLLRRSLSAEESMERMRRLELAAGLLPALLHVLDIREVFDRLSIAARQALPHDLLLLILFNDDLTQVRVFARSGKGPDMSAVVRSVYPSGAIRYWEFDIVDDHLQHPFESTTPATRLGARSSMRFPIRFDDRVIGGVTFVAFEPGRYTGNDVPVGRRLADHVAVGLSHYTLAQQMADQVRRTEELRARSTNMELLDAMLATLADEGDLPQVIDRISNIAQKVLPHDALAMPVVFPDGLHARMHVTKMPEGARLPEVIEVPPHLRNSEWEYDLVDDLQAHPEQRTLAIAKLGYRSVLRLSIRNAKIFAGVGFYSFKPGFFKPEHVPIGRRIADRLALSLLREKEQEAAQRAHEASERASHLESRVQALTEELNALSGFHRVIGESPKWKEVLTHATRVASTPATVLLLGESGTGKEVVARFVHKASARTGPFVAINCAALPEHLLEAELFGYERGAYTGAMQSKPGQLEQAAGGTLFLDEVGEMSPAAQAKFLRVLQEREFQRLGGTRMLKADVRVVAATNRDLLRAIGQGHFREDLYYRLSARLRSSVRRAVDDRAGAPGRALQQVQSRESAGPHTPPALRANAEVRFRIAASHSAMNAR